MTDEYKNNEKDAFSETQCTVYVIILKLTLHAANQKTKFEDSSTSRFGDISAGVKFQNVSRDPNYAHQEDSQSSKR